MRKGYTGLEWEKNDSKYTKFVSVHKIRCNYRALFAYRISCCWPAYIKRQKSLKEVALKLALKPASSVMVGDAAKIIFSTRHFPGGL